MSKKSKERKEQLKHLATCKGVIKERLELLTQVVDEMKQTGNAPSTIMGSLFDDLMKLNPFRAEVLLPKLLEQYEQELEEVEHLIANQN